MDYQIFIVGLLLISLLILFWRYAELKGKMEQRVRQIFEEWRERELESTSKRKAEILFEEWKQRYEKEIRKDAVEKSIAVIVGKVTEDLIPFYRTSNKTQRMLAS